MLAPVKVDVMELENRNRQLHRADVLQCIDRPWPAAGAIAAGRVPLKLY